MAGKQTKKGAILVLGAHSDDFVIGAGGTIAKYAKEKKRVVSIVFSYGEKSHPWLKERVIRKVRAQEALEASKILGCKTEIYDLEEINLREDYQKKNLERKILIRINKLKPEKIFTHSMDDPHPDHQAVYKITLELWRELPKPKPELYVYSVWNPLPLRTSYPILYEDVTRTFPLKMKALRIFRSQKIHALYPSFLMFYRAIMNGFKIRKKFAEGFYRIK